MAKFNIPCIDAGVVEQIKRENLNVSSEERAKIFSKYLNEKDAFDFNKLFERSKVLKNQELAYNRLLDEVLPKIDEKGNPTQFAEKKAKLKENIIKERERKHDLMYNSDGSINDNFETLLGHSNEEWKAHTKKIFDAKYDIEIPDELIDEITALRKEIDSYEVGSEEWGAARVKLADVIDDIKNPTNKLGFMDTLAYKGSKIKQEYNKAKGFFPKAGVAAKSVGEILSSPAYRAVKASVDLSFGLNQGYKILLDSPKNWGKSMSAAIKSLGSFGSKEFSDAFHVKLMSDPAFDKAVNSGLRIGGLEEYFQDTLFSKIPGMGTIIKMSDNAFTAFVQTARFNVYKEQLKVLNEISKQTGKEIPKEAYEDIARVANSITGSGSFGKKGEAMVNSLNSVFFAPRYTKSMIDTVTMPLKLGVMDKTARIRSAKLLLKYIGSFMAISGAISLIAPDRIQNDPRSPQYGKIKVGKDRWIPFGGPLPSYISTLTRLLTGSTVSKSGKVTELNTGDYGGTTRENIVMNFAKNKLAPVPSIISQAWLTGKDYKGDKFDPTTIPDSLLTPISPGNIYELLQTDPDTFEAIMLGAGEMFGLSSSNYSNKKTEGPIESIIKYSSNK